MLVGVEGSAFSVDIDESGIIDDLKKVIKKENEGTIKCDARELQLYLAKRDDKWLKDDDHAVAQLENGIITDDIEAMIKAEQMRATWSIQECLDEKSMEALARRQIHVLVNLPTHRDGKKKNLEISKKTIHHSNRLKRWRELNEVLDRNKKAKKTINEDGEDIITTRYSDAT